MVREHIIVNLFKLMTMNRLARNVLVKKTEKYLYKNIVDEGDKKIPKKVRVDKYHGIMAMIYSIMRNLDRKNISKRYANRLVSTLVKNVFYEDSERKKAVKKYVEKYGMRPPLFVTISPTKICNLNCVGCYASSTDKTSETLEWSHFDRIVKELHDDLGMRFFVISGGEPLLYRSEGKRILDLPKKWKDCFFLMYTNGTLITKEVAEEMEKLGNITPAISIEGFEEHTDNRRGKGVHKKILNAFENLKNAGVMFGISVTATKYNADVLLKDEFYEHYFEEVGVSYMWQFHYMPIGRAFTLDLMVTPEQRFLLFNKWKALIYEKRYFVADFWNSGTLSDGCVSCARSGGYFYIDWNGNIMPCVFVPYYKDNIKNIFAENRKIRDALFSDFFVKGREWQRKYLNKENKGNMLLPCFIRDHHKNFLEIARSCNVLPQDKAAEDAMKDEEYHRRLIEYDKEIEKIEEPIWVREYLEEKV